MTVDVTKLANGLTVVSETMPRLESAALGLWVKAGARNERREQHGISHLLEHMAFKGTKSRTAMRIAEEIENVGGEVNAATSLETTAYYARVLKDDVALAGDILHDILAHSVFDARELKLEQHVIVQEIGAAEDAPDDVVFDLFQNAAFGSQPIGRSILGTPHTVNSFGPGDLRDYLASHYRGPAMVLAAAGAVDHGALVAQAQSGFGQFNATPGEPPAAARYTGGELLQERDFQETQVVLGFEGRAYHARDYYASQLLATILGGGMSSRLFQEVREKRGLCYSVSAFHWGFSDSGVFGVHAATGESDLPKLLPVVIDELRRAADSIDEAEANRARAQIRSGLLMSMESPSSRAGQIARQILLFGRPIPPAELNERLAAISTQRLRELAGRMFCEGTPTLAAAGQLKGMMRAGEIAERLGVRKAAAE
jgi:predicted Zn-dependent peptidase